MTAATMTAPLTVAGVTHRFGGDTVLRDATLTATAGEVVAVVGPSGSGKTTLLAIAGALLRPDAGAVTVGGTDLAAASERARARVRAREIGFVFQAANLAPFLPARRLLLLNARIAGASGAEASARAAELLDAVGLGGRDRAHPGELSGGERQRLAVAAALAKAPPLLLADEPTAALDTERGREVMHLIGDLARARGTAVVLSTHDERMLDLCDRVLALRDGALGERD